MTLYGVKIGIYNLMPCPCACGQIKNNTDYRLSNEFLQYIFPVKLLRNGTCLCNCIYF